MNTIGFVAATGRRRQTTGGGGRDYRPVINVSYFDIASYIEWLSHQTENSYDFQQKQNGNMPHVPMSHRFIHGETIRFE